MTCMEEQYRFSDLFSSYQILTLISFDSSILANLEEANAKCSCPVTSSTFSCASSSLPTLKYFIALLVGMN